MKDLINYDLGEARQEITKLRRALEDIRDLFDGEADADFRDGAYVPNRAMRVDQIVAAAIGEPKPNGARKMTDAEYLRVMAEKILRDVGEPAREHVERLRQIADRLSEVPREGGDSK